MGFDARQVDALSLPELIAAAEGWKRANGAEEKPPAPSYEDHLRMRERWANA